MKEHYYEITKESPHYEEWFGYIKAEKKMKADVKAFCKEHNISAEQYILYKDKLWVDPQLNKQFADQFGKEREEGFAPFKKTSAIGRAFAQTGIKRAQKPFVPFFFKKCPEGRSSTRLFDFEGKVYCQCNCDSELDTPNGFIPMKASKFYEVIERATETDGE